MIKKFHIVLAVLSMFVSGCALTGYYGDFGAKGSEKIRATRLEAKTFIGKSKEDVLARYGKPLNILYDLVHHVDPLGRPNSYTVYDESWYYKYDAGIPILWPNQYSINFYFIDGVVRLVTG